MPPADPTPAALLPWDSLVRNDAFPPSTAPAGLGDSRRNAAVEGARWMARPFWTSEDVVARGEVVEVDVEREWEVGCDGDVSDREGCWSFRVGSWVSWIRCGGCSEEGGREAREEKGNVRVGEGRGNKLAKEKTERGNGQDEEKSKRDVTFQLFFSSKEEKEEKTTCERQRKRGKEKRSSLPSAFKTGKKKAS